MISLTTTQLADWLERLFWPFVRIGACFMVAPVFGAQTVPGRIRIVFAGAIAALIAPLVPVPPQVEPLSATGCLVTVQQVLIGLVMGFCLQLLFDAVTLGGQMLANSMGLSLAMNVDPQRGSASSSPALGQLYSLLVILTYLTLDGHLALIETLVRSFTTLPIGLDGLGSAGLHAAAAWGGQLFAAALAIALPGVTALLIVHVAFGVMSRAAPALNLFAVGLPVSLLFGLTIVLAGLLGLQSTFVEWLGRTFGVLRVLIGAEG